jgi:hypothetical protein
MINDEWQMADVPWPKADRSESLTRLSFALYPPPFAHCHSPSTIHTLRAQTGRVA